MQQETIHIDYERIYQAFSTLSNELPRLLNPNTIHVMNDLKMNMQNLQTQQTAVLEERFDKLQNSLDSLNGRLDRFEELLLGLPLPSVANVRENYSANVVHASGDNIAISEELTHFSEPDTTDRNIDSVTAATLITPPVSSIGGDLTATSQELTQDSQQDTALPLQTDSDHNIDSSINEACVAPNSKSTEVTGDEHDYNIGDIVLANVSGYPPWPGRVLLVPFQCLPIIQRYLVGPEDASGALIHEPPVTSSKRIEVYYVRLWVSAKCLSLLQKHDIEAYIKEPHNPSVELLRAYQTALDPSSWEASLSTRGASTIDGVKEKNKEDVDKRGEKRRHETETEPQEKGSSKKGSVEVPSNKDTSSVRNRNITVAFPTPDHHQTNECVRADCNKGPVRATKRVRIEMPAIETNVWSTVDKDRAVKQHKYKFGDIVLAKVQEHLSWPGRIVDPEDVSLSEAAALENLLSDDMTKFCLVRFFSRGDHSWTRTKDISPLQKHELKAYINKPNNKSIELLKAYKIAMESMDPLSWLISLGDSSACGRENSEADELDDIEEDKGKCPVIGASKERKCKVSVVGVVEGDGDESGSRSESEDENVSEYDGGSDSESGSGSGSEVEVEADLVTWVGVKHNSQRNQTPVRLKTTGGKVEVKKKTPVRKNA